MLLFLLFGIEATLIHHVVVFGIDGLARSQLKLAMDTGLAPNLLELKASSSYTWNARSVQPSYSYPNWNSILTAIDTPFHGINSNNWKMDHPQVISIEGPCKRSPNVISILRKYFPRERMGAFYSWPVIGEMLKPKQYLNESISAPDSVSFELVLKFIQKKPLFTFFYLDDIDTAGHAHGFGSIYNDAIKTVDERIGKVISECKKLGIFNQTLFVSITDHGRREPRGIFHGSFSNNEMNTFWMISGPGIHQNKEIFAPVANYDAMPSILYALGKQPPLNWRGRPVAEIFINTPTLMFPLNENITDKEWFYSESSKEFEEEVQSCLSSFHLVTSIFWGDYDPATFVVGIVVGVLSTSFVIVLLYGFVRRSYYMKVGYY